MVNLLSSRLYGIHYQDLNKKIIQFSLKLYKIKMVVVYIWERD